MENISKNTSRRQNRITHEQAFALNGKVPPQALEIESVVLGSLMLNEDALNNTIQILHPEYFYKRENEIIFRAILRLFEQAKPVDLLTVTQQLMLDGQLDEAGGSLYLAQLTNRVVSTAHIESHCRILSEKYIQREIIRIATETLKDAYDESTDVINLLDKTETRLMDIDEKSFHTEYRSMDDVLKEAYHQIEELQSDNSTSFTGVPSGFVELDRKTAGFQPGTLIILAARPAMGKTAFALSIARNIAVDFNKPVAFFSLEMSAVELVMRLISSESNIPGERLKKGEKLPDNEKEQLYERTQALSNAPIFIDDSPQLSIFELRAKCRRLKQQHHIEMVFIDYLQLMQAGDDSRKGGNREQEISTISRQLKALSKELSIPVLALSQLSRAVETRGGNKKPQLSDLRESGAIEQDADIVMFIYRPEYYKIDFYDDGSPTKNIAEINLAKHRSGSVGDVKLRFISNLVKFENLSPQDDPIISSALNPNNNFESGSTPGYYVVESKMNQMPDTDQTNENQELFE